MIWFSILGVFPFALMLPYASLSWTAVLSVVIGLILASVGLAGVTAYSVSQRRREIGIRMALGARRGDVLGLVMKEGALLVGVGTIVADDPLKHRAAAPFSTPPTAARQGTPAFRAASGSIRFSASPARWRT